MKTIVKAVRDGRTCRVCWIASGYANDLDVLHRACENPGGCRCVMLPFAPLVSPTATIAQRIVGWFADARRASWRRASRDVTIVGVAVAGHRMLFAPAKPGVLAFFVFAIVLKIAGEMLDRLYGRKL